MSNLMAHAVAELDRIGCEEGEFTGRKEVLDIIDIFSRQGHSGSSAAWVTAVVEKLLRYEPLSALTDDPAEWNHIADEMPDAAAPGLWQSRRDPAAFSIDGGKTYKRNGSDEIHTSAAH